MSVGKRITRFEDLEIWKKARHLTSEVYRVTSQGAIRRHFALRDQLQKSAISIMSNIAEGFERDGNREFIQALYIVKGSSGELRSQLTIALDQGFLNSAEFKEFAEQIDHLNRMIARLIQYLRSSPFKGPKFVSEK